MLIQTSIRRNAWNTYAVRGYTHDVTGCSNPASEGGVHKYQVRRGPAGWQRRILQSNGLAAAAGPVEPISDAEGEALFERARNY